jgi:hypothetical protein
MDWNLSGQLSWAGGETYYIKGLFLVKECYHSFLILGNDHVYDHLNINDVFTPIPARDEIPLALINYYY